MKKIFNLLRRFSLYVSLVVVIGIMVGGYFFNKKLNQEIKKTEEQIKTKYQEVKKYETEKEKAPSPELIGKLEKKKGFLEKQFEIMLNSFSTYYPTTPEFTRYPSIEFKEYIYFSEEKLQKMAKMRDVNISFSLPFPKTGLIDVNLIPGLTKKFEVVKDLIKLVIDAGVTKIDYVAHEESTSVLFYEKIPLTLGISGTSNEIMRCIKYFDNPSSYFTVENVLIKNVEENIYKAEIKLNAVILKSKKEQQG